MTHYCHVSNLNLDMLHLLLSCLSAMPTSAITSSCNKEMQHTCADMLTHLKSLPAPQLLKLAQICRDTHLISIQINVSALREQIDHLKLNKQHHLKQQQKARWLIQNKASDRQIMTLCSLIEIEDIKSLRAELGIPANKGRRILPPYKVREVIYEKWHRLSSEQADEYQRYQELLQHFPEFELGQLYNIIKTFSLEKENEFHNSKKSKSKPVCNLS